MQWCHLYIIFFQQSSTGLRWQHEWHAKRSNRRKKRTVVSGKLCRCIGQGGVATSLHIGPWRRFGSRFVRPPPFPPMLVVGPTFFVIFLVFFVTVVIVVRSGSGFGQLSMEVKRSLLGRDRVLFCPTRCVDLECGIQFSCVAINATFISYSCVSWAATLPFLLESQVHALFSRRPYLKQFLYKISKPSQLKILSRKYLKKWK